VAHYVPTDPTVNTLQEMRGINEDSLLIPTTEPEEGQNST